MSNHLSSFMLKFPQTNFICQSVNLTDDLKIGLQYDIQQGLLNIFVNNSNTNTLQSSQINIHSNPYETNSNNYLFNSSKTQQNEITYWQDNDEPKICIELSNIYSYDIEDDDDEDVDDYENENNYCETMITSSSSPSRYSSSISSASSSCFDEQTTDNDDGYSTHSLDDTEQQHQQQHSLSILPSKCLVSYQYDGNDCSKESVSCLRHLIEELIWLNPYRKSIRQMMMNNSFFE